MPNYELETQRALRNAINLMADQNPDTLSEQLKKSLRAILSAEQDLSPMQRVDLREELEDLLRDYKTKLADVYGKEKDEVFRIIVLRKYKDDVLLYRPAAEVIAKYKELSSDTITSLYALIKAAVLSGLSFVEKMEFVNSTSPLFSKLKRLLITERENGEAHCNYSWENAEKHKFTKADKDGSEWEGLQNAVEVQNHNLIDNDLAAKLIANLVNKETNLNQAENLIKKWFEGGSFICSPGQHSQTLDTLFRLAYAFRLDLRQFDDLCESAADSFWDALDAAQDMLRFGLHFKISYKRALELTQYYLTYQKPKVPAASQNDAREQITAFFSENPSEKYGSDSDGIQERFYALLNMLGTTGSVSDGKDSTAVHFKWRETDEELSTIRRDTFVQMRDRMIAMLTENNGRPMILLQQRLNREADHIPDEYETRQEEINEYLRKHLKAIQDSLLTKRNLLGNLCGFTTDQWLFGKLNTNSPVSVLSRLCDGDKVYETYFEWTSDPLTTRFLNNPTEVKRNHILRMAYLDTLLHYLLENLSDEQTLALFEQTAAEKLEQCMFTPLNLTLPLDLLLYESLAETKLFKPLAYQMFIPRRIN